MSEICLWKEKYRIGNNEIDEQHYLLFSKIENLLASLPLRNTRIRSHILAEVNL
mgnify:CR=1 FL=1